MDIDTFYHEYDEGTLGDFEETYVAFLQAFEHPFPSEKTEEYDLGFLVGDVLDDCRGQKDFEKIFKMRTLLEETHPQIFEDVFAYFAEAQVDYLGFQREANGLWEAVKGFEAYPVRYFDLMLVCLKKMAYYGHREPVRELIASTFKPISKSNNFISDVTVELRRFIYWEIVESVYAQQQAGESIDWKAYQDHWNTFGKDLTPLDQTQIAEGLQRPLADWGEWLQKDFGRDRLGDLLSQAQLGFVAYAQGYEIPAIVAASVWDYLFFYCLEYKRPAKLPGFFRLKKKFLEEFLIKQQGMIMDYRFETVMILWGFCYAFDFLYKTGILPNDYYEQSKSDLKSLRTQAVAGESVSLWTCDFVHDWQKPDMDTEAEWEAERAIFTASFSRKSTFDPTRGLNVFDAIDDESSR
jgi:hypothetical protein